MPHSDKEAEILKETAVAPYCVVKPILKIRQKREKSQKQLTAGFNLSRQGAYTEKGK